MHEPKPDLWPDSITDVTEAKQTAEALLNLARKGVRLSDYQEQIVSLNASASYRYAKDILKKRFVLGEPAIAKLAFTALSYAKHILYEDPIIRGSLRFPEAEPSIARDAYAVLEYAQTLVQPGDFIFGSRRFPLGEYEFARDVGNAGLALQYARDIIKSPWRTINYEELGLLVEEHIKTQNLTELYEATFNGAPLNGSLNVYFEMHSAHV